MNKYFDLFSKITPPELLYIIDGKKTIQIYNYKGGDFMSLKKTTLGVLMAMTMTVPASMTCNCLTASATTSSEVILRALYTKSCNSDLSISGTNAICKSIVIGYSGQTTQIGITQILEKKNSSGTWVYCKSSSITQDGSYAKLENTFKNLAKGTYRLKTSAVVHEGKYYENVVRYSSEKTVK